MKVSTRVEYGLIALTDIVIFGEKGTSVSAPEIAQRERIPRKYLEHILLLLRQAGFIEAHKGIRGGYALARAPEEVTLSEVLNALDSGILAEMETPESGGLRPVLNRCFWGEINERLNSYAENLTLSDFAGRCRDASSADWDLYVI
ncbi:MAG: Rrf2 family transcriptional regulator [Lachnospiraceae bacterium]|nr:Rrf2 family transcriptional regulator [Lachnospiraceae bacterium]